MFSLFNSLLFGSKFSVYEITEKFFRNQDLELLAKPSLTSTNDIAKDEAFSLSTPLKIYLADEQTKGRGRNSNQWSNAAKGGALMLSFSFHMPGAPQPICTPMVGLALLKSLRDSLSCADLSLKAPNDVLLKGKKVAGLLTEAAQMGTENRLIIGIGLNVFSHPENEAQATHLSAEVKLSRARWEKFLESLLRSMRLASQGALGAHLSESQRQELLEALNANPNLSKTFDSVSPFGDLSSENEVTSWRDL